ncbi:hypothetical protein [Methanobacterium oryzae]|uniref:hypothetical protein n=1 Tax=Methanobacterium oryzae TaxID=69540 RepID=UPI003D2060AF
MKKIAIILALMLVLGTVMVSGCIEIQGMGGDGENQDSGQDQGQDSDGGGSQDDESGSGDDN